MGEQNQYMVHPGGAEFFPQLIRDKTDVTLVFPKGFDSASRMVSMEGNIVEAEGNVARFCIHPRNLPLLPSDKGSALPALLPIELNFVTSLNREDGSSLVLLFRGTGKLLNTVCGARDTPTHFTLMLDDNLAVRRDRRHKRHDWKEGMYANAGLGNVAALPQTLNELRQPLESTLLGTHFRPEIVNISLGGICLIVPRDYAEQPDLVPDGFLFVCTTAKPGERKRPTVLLCRRVGERPDLAEDNRVALRLQFVKELDWSKSTDNLVWKDVSRTGSGAINEFFRQFPKGLNVWKKG